MSLDIQNYRQIKCLKTSLEYKLCQTLDLEERKILKQRCMELKATLKYLLLAVESLTDVHEYEVIYYSYIKEGWERKSIPRIAQELYISEDWAYAKRKSGKDKVNKFLKYLDPEDEAYKSLITLDKEINKKGKENLKNFNAQQIALNIIENNSIQI